MKQAHVRQSISEVNEGAWNNVVEQSEGGSVFHRTGWLRAVEEGLGRPARHLVVEKSGNPISVFPNFLVDISVPDIGPVPFDGLGLRRLTSLKPGFGGPVFVGDEQTNFEVTFDNAKRLFAETDAMSHLLKPSSSNFARYASQLADRGYRSEVRSCRFVIDLRQGWDEIKSNMHRSKRSNLKRASENSATVEDRQLDDVALEEFYNTYTSAMDRVDGIQYPFRFFEVLQRELADRIKLFTVTADGEFAGGQLYLLDDESSTMHEFFRGLDAEYFEYNPSELISERAIKWAIEHGYDEYDLGSTAADFTSGSFTYKEELGGELRPIIVWERGDSTPQWHIYRAGRWFVRNQDRIKA